MNLMTWTSAMSVGVPELDEDHRVLIRIINQLAESEKNRNHAGILRQSLYSLLRYVEFHFAREERVLAACDFPGMTHHKQEHRAFRRSGADPKLTERVLTIMFAEEW